MAAITICSDFGAQKNKAWHCFHCSLKENNTIHIHSHLKFCPSYFTYIWGIPSGIYASVLIWTQVIYFVIKIIVSHLLDMKKNVKTCSLPALWIFKSYFSEIIMNCPFLIYLWSTQMRHANCLNSAESSYEVLCII